MNAINPNKSFRVLTRSKGEFKTVVNRAIGWGFEWVTELPDKKTPYAVVFYPNADGKRIIRRQMEKKMPTVDLVAYAAVRIYRFDYFINSQLRYATRDRNVEYSSYPVKAIHAKTGEEHEFESCALAIQWLADKGHKKAARHAIYQCIQKFNSRLTAYGYRWERVDVACDVSLEGV